MSWSFGGYNDRGLILDEESFRNLLRFGTDKTREILQLEEDETLETAICDYELTELSYCFTGIDTAYLTVGGFGKLVGINKNGFAEYTDGVYENFEDCNVFIIYLKKDTLTKKYSCYGEIIEEVEKFVVEEMGIDIDKLREELGFDYIRDRIGNLNGFYSDR